MGNFASNYDMLLFASHRQVCRGAGFIVFACAGSHWGTARLQTAQWAATLRSLAASPAFQRLEFERALQGMHAEVQQNSLCLVPRPACHLFRRVASALHVPASACLAASSVKSLLKPEGSKGLHTQICDLSSL